VWELLAGREPLCLITDLSGPTSGHTSWFTTPPRPTTGNPNRPSDSSDGAPTTAPRSTRKATPTGTRIKASRSGTASSCSSPRCGPTSRLLIVGDGLLADAFIAQARLLGWTPSVTIDLDAARGTQQARPGWLMKHGVTPEEIAAIRGPAGLDIGSRTPAEIALAITAEVLAVRHAATGAALRDSAGPIHTDHLNTPPARTPHPCAAENSEAGQPGKGASSPTVSHSDDQPWSPHAPVRP
jgi:XdhC Rossmann domain